MKKFNTLEALVAPLDRANVDTDAIIPKQFLKSIKRTGFGPNLFDEWRYLDSGEPGKDNSTRPINPDFVLNLARYEKAQILLTRANFGCGSSREHAPWALADYGFRAIIAPSYADIFSNNCFKNSLLPVVLNENCINKLFSEVENTEGYSLSIYLAEQQVVTPSGEVMSFEVDAFKKHCLMQGLDDIGLTLELKQRIVDYEANRRSEKPWMF